MTTGSYDSDTARQEQLLEDGRDGRPLVPYKALWAVLLLRLGGQLRRPDADRARWSPG